MSNLKSELRRLYLCTAPHGAVTDDIEPGLITPDGRVRAMVLELARPADWKTLSTLWRGVQTDLELPAPAIAVNGIDGYQLWFSLAQPVAVADVQACLESLHVRYWGAIAPERIAVYPSLEATMPRKMDHAALIRAQRPETEQWSAFVAPDLATLFSGQPWLDVCPSPDAQANVLSRLESIEAADFHTAQEKMRLTRRTEKAPRSPDTAEQDAPLVRARVKPPALQTTGLDPQRFLLDVMNDTAVDLHLRIEAAKALLPYSQGQ